MIRIFVTYEAEPESDRLAEHIAVCRRIPGATVRHGAIQRTLFGAPLEHYVEFEFADPDAWRSVSTSEEFAAAASDAAAMGIAHSVYVVEID
jgi:hypothetical protein